MKRMKKLAGFALAGVIGLGGLGTFSPTTADAADNSYKDMKWAWPTTDTKITDPFGKTGGRWHKGIDIGVKKKEVYASGNAKVAYTGTYSDGIVAMALEHTDTDPKTKKKLITRYLHLQENSFAYKKGDTVKKGAKIAISGNTGKNVGYHLHFDVNAQGDTTPGDKDTIDPMLFYPNVKTSLTSKIANLDSIKLDHSNCYHNLYDDKEHFFDQLLIDFVGQNQYKEWFNSKEESERTMTNFKKNFGLSDKKVKEILGE
ncbi:M23 family metallopeptidase [Bacillus sp. S10(2024)]|uniref:M23 family metallopeptidase n=1 Tax=Bacillus sp. S10(2024) TaxID=3162886 RepID=UPI003D1FCFE4